MVPYWPAPTPSTGLEAGTRAYTWSATAIPADSERKAFCGFNDGAGEPCDGRSSRRSGDQNDRALQCPVLRPEVAEVDPRRRPGKVDSLAMLAGGEHAVHAHLHQPPGDIVDAE